MKKEAEGEKEEVEEDKERNPLVKADDLLSSTDQVRKEAEGEKEEAKVEEIAVGSAGEEEKEKPTQEQALASDDQETSADQQKLGVFPPSSFFFLPSPTSSPLPSLPFPHLFPLLYLSFSHLRSAEEKTSE